MKPIALSAAVLTAVLLAAPVHADIAPDPEFGESLAPRERTAVAMTAETVSIRLGPDKARVRAVFTLENTGGATTLEVGFPDVVTPKTWSTNRPPEGVSKYRLHGFRASIDGKTVEHRHRFLQKKDSPFEAGRGDGDDWLYAGWLLWDMTFTRGQKREVQVDYRVPYRPPYKPTLLGDRTFTYILKTGAPWHGPIGRAVIEVTFDEGVIRDHLGAVFPGGYERIERGIRWVLTDLEPTEDVRIVVQKYTDMPDAARGYTALADALEKKGKPGDAAHTLARAARCQEGAKQYEDCIASCRRIVEYEENARSRGRRAGLKFWWKDPYVPWQCTIVRCLVALDRKEDARAAAKEAIAAIRAVLADAELSGFIRKDELEERAKRLEAFTR